MIIIYRMNLSELLILCTFSFHVTVKAKTSEQVVNSRPVPGVLDRTLAEEYKVTYLPVHVRSTIFYLQG